jgi:hypothetical protein
VILVSQPGNGVVRELVRLLGLDLFERVKVKRKNNDYAFYKNMRGRLKGDEMK